MEKRKNVAFELLDTERSYIHSLQTLCDVFLRPAKEKKVLPTDFALENLRNVESILSVNQEFLSELEERMENWHPHQILSDIFIKYLPRFQVYSKYVNGYHSLINTLLKEMENTHFASFLEKARQDPRCRFLELNDFIIMPIQRLPRYILLLSALQKYTDNSEEQEKLSKTVLGLKNVTNEVNENKRLDESSQRIRHIETRMRGKMSVLLHKEGRLLLKEGVLNQVPYKKNQEETRFYVFLFTDIFLCSKQVKKRKSHVYDYKTNL